MKNSVDKSVGDSCQAIYSRVPLQDHLHVRLRRNFRRCKAKTMGMKFDIDTLYDAQRDADERRSRIRNEMMELEKEYAALGVELEELSTTIRTLKRIVSIPDDEAEQGGSDEDGGIARGAARRRIERALFTFAREGKTAGEIREYIDNRYRTEIQPNTLSVTLNRLKAAGLARLLEGQKWHPVSVSGERTLATILEDDDEPPPEKSDIDDEIPF